MTVTRRTATLGGLAGAVSTLGGLLPAPKGKFQLMLRLY